MVNVFPDLSTLQKRFGRNNLGDPSPETFEQTQRRRLLQANILAMAIAVLACVSEIFTTNLSHAKLHLIVAVPMFAWYFICHKLAKKNENVQNLARIWMAVGCLALWLDISVSGGLNGQAAQMLYLLPIGSALILKVRDIAIVSAANIIAIIILAAADYLYAVNSLVPMSGVFAKAGIIIITAACISVTVLVLIVHNDQITNDLRSALKQTVHISMHDQLTGLLNRKWVNEQLDALDPDVDVCDLFVIDLDGFKQVNDVYGHAMGDALLKDVAMRLVEICPETASVARLGGDEFLILSPSKALTDFDLGDRIIAELSKPFHLGDLEVLISGSVGQALYPADAHSSEQLLARADAALYAAKSAGRNQHVRFHAALEEKQLIRSRVLKRLRHAIETDKIYINYQPQYALTDGRIVGVEALARWNDPDIGQIPPDQFIPIAEEYGLICKLGEHVIRRACREAKYWIDLANPGSELRLSIKLSPLQLSKPDIVSVIGNILDEVGFPADRLELEITERVLIADPTQAQRKLQQLAEMGVKIALDDFGKGYSSLSYLRSLPLSRLKIDQSYTANIEKPKGAAFIRAIIQLATALNLDVIAEGVETERQRDLLLAMECPSAQGYLYSEAVDPQRMLKLFLAPLRKLHTNSVSERIETSHRNKKTS